ncbi:MAG: FAD-binding oxidoreductase [Planctomycetes bacterium]|nr:FAD-binding oxidoreductase [Planctomycetota bacterium]
MSAADAIVIGGGVMGLFTALHLADQGAGRVVLLEKRYLGAGSSGKSGAILRQHYSHETTVRMSRESLLFYREFTEQYGRDIGFRQTGMLFTCHAGDRAALDGNVALQRGLGVDVDVLDHLQLTDLEPRARFEADAIGAFERESGFVDPAAAMAAVAELGRERGVDVREGAEVVDVLVDGDAGVRGVRLADGDTIASDVVVNAGGPWAGRLCRRLGIDVPLTAIRPEQAFFKPPEVQGPERIVCGDLLTGLYWKPEMAGWTRVGKMAYDGDAVVDDPDRYDEGVSDAFITECRDRIVDRLPHYADAVSWGGCAALYTVTPDAHALIGAVEGIPGLYLASGFSGHGFKMGPAVGCGLAALITGAEGGSFDPAFFAVDRFAHGRAVSTSYEYGILG